MIILGTEQVPDMLTAAADIEASPRLLQTTYQWYHCYSTVQGDVLNTSDPNCWVIPGATHATYYPTNAVDAGYALGVVVVVSNAIGSTTLVSHVTDSIRPTPGWLPPQPTTGPNAA